MVARVTCKELMSFINLKRFGNEQQCESNVGFCVPIRADDGAAVLGDKVAHKKAFVKLCGCSSNNNGNLVLLLIFREGIRLCLDRGLQDFIAFEFGS